MTVKPSSELLMTAPVLSKGTENVNPTIDEERDPLMDEYQGDGQRHRYRPQNCASIVHLKGCSPIPTEQNERDEADDGTMPKDRPASTIKTLKVISSEIVILVWDSKRGHEMIIDGEDTIIEVTLSIAPYSEDEIDLSFDAKEERSNCDEIGDENDEDSDKTGGEIVGYSDEIGDNNYVDQPYHAHLPTN